MLVRRWEGNLDGLAVDTYILGLVVLIDRWDMIGWFEFIDDEVVVLLGVDEGLVSEEDFEGVFAL